MKLRVISSIAALFLITPSSWAADVPANSPLAAVYACRSIDNDAARLACFDQAVAVVQKKEISQEIVAVDSVKAKDINRRAFGLPSMSLPKLGLPDFGSSAKIDNVTLAVSRIYSFRRTYRLEMENGDIWEITGGDLKRAPKGDLTAEIRAKSLGSYKMTLISPSRKYRNLKVKRIQ